MGLNTAGFEKRIAPGERILIDTSVFVAYLNGPAIEATYPVAQYLIESMVGSRNEAIVSTITAMELFVKPLRAGPPGGVHVHGFLTHTQGISLKDVDLQVAHEGASIKATHNFKTPDALIAATGIVYQVSHLVTNDHRWREKLRAMKSRIQVTLLKDYL